MKKIFLIIFTLFAFLSFTLPASAQISNQPLKNNPCVYRGGPGIEQIPTINCIPILAMNLIFYALIFSGTIAVFMIIFAGYKVLISSGDQKKLESARKMITWAIIGLVTILLSFAIVGIIAEITGVRCITKFGFGVCGDESAPTETGRNKCGPNNSNGWCQDPEKSCVFTRYSPESSTAHYECKYKCSNSHHKLKGPDKAWCPTGKKCTEIFTPYGTSYYQCDYPKPTP